MGFPFGRNVFLALVAGAAGGLILPVIRDAVSGRARPAAKQAIRAGLRAYEQASEVVGEWVETAADLVAEVQAEAESDSETGSNNEPIDGEQIVPFEARSSAGVEKKHHA